MAKIQKTKKNDNELLTKKEFWEAKTETDQKFEKIDQKFEKADQRFERIEHALESQAKTLIDHGKKLEELDEKMSTLATKSDINRIIDIMDNYVKKTEDLANKSIVNTYRINELETKTSILDKRLSAIESR